LIAAAAIVFRASVLPARIDNRLGPLTAGTSNDLRKGTQTQTLTEFFSSQSRAVLAENHKYLA
jgi:hypothetical protein